MMSQMTNVADLAASREIYKGLFRDGVARNRAIDLRRSPRGAFRTRVRDYLNLLLLRERPLSREWWIMSRRISWPFTGSNHRQHSSRRIFFLPFSLSLYREYTRENARTWRVTYIAICNVETFAFNLTWKDNGAVNYPSTLVHNVCRLFASSQKISPLFTSGFKRDY